MGISEKLVRKDLKELDENSKELEKLKDSCLRCGLDKKEIEEDEKCSSWGGTYKEHLFK